MAKANMAKAKWLKRVAGEISKLRNMLFNSIYSIKTGASYSAYKLDSSRVVYALARQLYHNTDDRYKLGAGFAKPVVNATVGFMGVPRFQADDEDAQEILDGFFDQNTSKMQRTHKNALREGDCFVWLTREEYEDAALYPESKARLKYNIIPPEQVKHIILNPMTNTVREYILESSHEWVDDNLNVKKAIVTQRISAAERIISVQGDSPPDIVPGVYPNIWGFIPIVHFRNDPEETRAYGHSELEAIEPFMKAYHDVFLSAIQGSKMHSTPKLKFKIKELEAFLKNNFGIDNPQEAAKKGTTLSLDGHEFFLFGDGEEAEYLEVKSATGSAEALLKLLFYCIVDTSETPEFIFGVHTPSSLSSVKEQMPIMTSKIARKREQFTESWQLLARMVLAMTAQAEMMHISTYATVLEWDEVDPRDDKEVAETLDAITRALNTAVQGDFLSVDAAADFLKEYIPSMKEYKTDDQEEDERTRILTGKLERGRLEDGATNIEESIDINKELTGDGEAA